MIPFLFVIGLVALVLGAELLVRGASRLALTFGISPLVVGLTVVAFGTSAPEMAVSLRSALGGLGDVAIGNVVGSNILNILLILGISALIVPLVVAQRLVRQEVPIMGALSLLVWWQAADQQIDRAEGGLLTALLIAYTLILVWQGRRESAQVRAEYDAALDPGRPGAVWHRHPATQFVFVIAGLVLLVFGAQWLVDAAVMLARRLGIGELTIGLTIVAAGTSLPELATSIVAAIRGERDIAVGNVVGSNIFNICAVLGISAMVAPTPLAVAPQLWALDLPFMVAVALACLPVFYTGHRIARWEGGLFIAYYLAYVVFLIALARRDVVLTSLGRDAAWFVLPITAMTLGLLAFREWRQGARSARDGD